jgi:hypothetical protein
MDPFPYMTALVPEASLGEAKVTHFVIGRHESMMAALRREYIPEGAYARLQVGGRLVMSDTPMERRTNRSVVDHAHGRVLIAGLGLGMILPPILGKPEVESVIVVERSADVVALIGPHFASPKLTLVVANVFDWKPARTDRFNCIYFDIWPDICTDNLTGINRLHRRFRPHLDRDDPGAWMGSWVHDELKARRRREQREREKWGWGAYR